MNKDESDIFITEFPKKGFEIIDQLQGRVQFAILDQIKFMKTLGINDAEIYKVILENAQKIIDNYNLKENKDNP
ncbi:MAG: hypothetical protein ITD33_06855 [Nitrosarchaeum sp.]|nr:hypothetical protein [Nitrosarchaeum sp.]MBP0120556.1 hypothetical protein [Nitrosarchaeum sp.]MBP0133491.1 hypothetical protein [Nitrosarchaeum sp.]